MNKKKILFVCIHNSARSQMAEAFVNRLCGERWNAQSAGWSRENSIRWSVEVMREAGTDISWDATKSVPTFCSRAAVRCRRDSLPTKPGERCPVFSGGGQRLHWGFPDPFAVWAAPCDEIAALKPATVRDAIHTQSSNGARRGPGGNPMMRARKKRVLFCLLQNSARSQVRAIMNQMCSDEYVATQCGTGARCAQPAGR
jgi:arsenate reductase